MQLPGFELLALIHFIVSGDKNVIFKTCLIQNPVAKFKATKSSLSLLTRKGAYFSGSCAGRL